MERANQDLGAVLHCVTAWNPSSWSNHLPWIVLPLFPAQEDEIAVLSPGPSLPMSEGVEGWPLHSADLNQHIADRHAPNYQPGSLPSSLSACLLTCYLKLHFSQLRSHPRLPVEPRLNRMVPSVLSLFLLIHLCLAALVPGTQREEPAVAPPPSTALANPFGTGETDRRLLQSYIQANLKDGQGPEISTWEQDVFFLFRLYDYDRSGHMDGLELMKLLSDYNSHNAPDAQASEPVVSMVDFLLQTHDLNQDGLLAPSELLSPPVPHTHHTQDSNSNDAPHQKQEVAAPNTDEEKETQQDNMAEDKESAEAIVSDVHKKISEAFEAFDHESNKTVDVREIGTIIRSLGCFPTEAELHDIIAEVRTEDHTGYIQFERFLPTMTKVLLERKFRPIPEDLVLQAFEVLDQQKKGYLEPEELTQHMMQEGEPFTKQEMDEMLSAAIDPEKNIIYYKDFVSMMTIDTDA
ncbi:uncharacterized protein ACN63O_011810 [Diretmus argenteus]